MIPLKAAQKFHGHLGPWLILGLLAGELALKKLKAEKYFGLSVKVWGAARKPKSCLIDGLQLSSGATYGKGNIQKISGKKVRLLFCNLKTNKKITLFLKDSLVKELEKLKGHKDSEVLAKKLYKTNRHGPFRIRYL